MSSIGFCSQTSSAQSDTTKLLPLEGHDSWWYSSLEFHQSLFLALHCMQRSSLGFDEAVVKVTWLFGVTLVFNYFLIVEISKSMNL